jgi:predicted ester cyclase
MASKKTQARPASPAARPVTEPGLPDQPAAEPELPNDKLAAEPVKPAAQAVAETVVPEEQDKTEKVPAGPPVQVMEGSAPDPDKPEPDRPEVASITGLVRPEAAPLPVMDVLLTDYSKFAALQGRPRRQSMRGFDEDYVDIIDYIVRVTHRIWEEKNVGLLYRHYAHNIGIYTADGMTYGRDKVIAETIKSIAAFPDVRIMAEEIIWSGNDVDGFHTSHRGVWMGTNTGYSNYGAPTGRRVLRRSVAHCIVRDNFIYEEWITRDELAVVWQLGFDAVKLAKQVAARDYASGVKAPMPVGTGEVERLLGQTTPEELPPLPPAFEPEDFARRAIHEIWNWRMFGKVRDYYVPNYVCNTTGNRVLYGLGALQANITQMIAAFPDARMLVDHVIWMGDEQKGYRVSVRWYLQGTHQGPGFYGEPTGKRIKMMGHTHYLIQDGKFVKEWTQCDEFALLKQIYWPV